jgi:hypothetical protein
VNLASLLEGKGTKNIPEAEILDSLLDGQYLTPKSNLDSTIAAKASGHTHIAQRGF